MAGIKLNRFAVYFLTFYQISTFFGNRASANMSTSRVSATPSSTAAKYQFPTTLEGFNVAFNGKFPIFPLFCFLFFVYFCCCFVADSTIALILYFIENGELRQIDPATGKAGDKNYEFAVKDDAIYNQYRYEALGEIITDYVYNLLEENGLQKIPLNPDDPNSSFVYGTKTDFSNTDKLLLLIHGSGVVRAGQWSRSLIINYSLDKGTQLPYIKRAKELGYDILITNTNDNFRENRPIAGSESPTKHGRSVWDRFISSATNLKHIGIVGHSYGGIVTVDLARNKLKEFKKLVFGVAFTDSVHSFNGQKDKDVLAAFIPVSGLWTNSWTV